MVDSQTPGSVSAQAMDSTPATAGAQAAVAAQEAPVTQPATTPAIAGAQAATAPPPPPPPSPGRKAGFAELSYYARWFFASKFLGRRNPLQSVLFITDRCNLRCAHCNVVKEGPEVTTMTYGQVREQLQYCYDLGSRIIDFEGGEPLLWRDDQAGADLNTLVDLARAMGFFSLTVTTNAQLPITANSDLVWISLDGLEQAHDEQRGSGSFARAFKNIDACEHPNLNVNMVVTNRNYRDFEPLATLVKEHPKLKRLSFSFYVPYESRGLLPTAAMRNEVIDQALRLKKAGYPLMNSTAGLKLLRDPQNFLHKRQCWISNFISSDGTRSPACPGERAGICDDCGFGMAPEMSLLFSFHPSMIKAGLTVRA
ncbi:MAG: radical SAM protein [Coriobacteriales bacterium]|nr:radical SAM protein [Coriobacteriales bacterium]